LLRTKYAKSQEGFFVGRTDNIEAAQDTLAFVILQVEQLYKAALGANPGMTTKQRGAFRKDFKRACAIRIYERCVEIVTTQTKGGTTGSTALVLVGHREQLKAEIDQHLADRNIRKARSSNIKFTSANGMVAGTNAGNAVDLNRTVGGSYKALGA
jgi:hypothetical protein